ncbi:MAG: ABC transporter ATP-binding protein/permease [Lachnospiraceae bacterium]|nr:ABC transporter ATP-binding protein/permease [Lachnospiraceae bacterium]
MFKELLKLFKPFKKSQYFVTGIAILEYSFLAIVTFSIKLIIDYLQEGQFELLFRIIMLCLSILVIVFFLSIANHYYWNKMVNESIIYLRNLVLKGIIRKDTQYFIANSSGSLLSKIMNDVVIVAQSAAIGPPMLMINAFRILIVVLALMYLNILITVAIIVFVPVYFLLFNLINKGIRRASEQEREKFADIQSNVQETLSAIETIKIYRKEDYVQKQSTKIMQLYLNKYKILNRFRSIGYGLSGVFSLFLPIIVLFLGAMMVFQNKMSLGSLISFYAFLPFLTEPINNLSDYYLGTQTTLGMSERVMEYLRDDSVKDGNIELKTVSALSFSKVTFRYNENQNFILKEFDLELKAGDKVAIMGKSGFGKSTLLRLLIRFLAPIEGNIKVEGIDLNEIKIESFYRNIALLQQDSFLFKDTLMNNITFGDEYEEEQINTAIDYANLLPFLGKMPNGLSYNIEEAGRNISGGEQQRIALARTLIRKASLLLLDEPTSALDENNERLLISNIQKYLERHNPIFIVITHRKKILDICDKVIYFRNGKVHNIDLHDKEQYELLDKWILDDGEN